MTSVEMKGSKWKLGPSTRSRGQRSESESAVPSAMESPGDWKCQYQGKSTKYDSKCRVESPTLGQAGCFVGSRAGGVGQLFEARSRVSSRYWTGSYRMWVYPAQVWLGSDQTVSMPRVFSLKIKKVYTLGFLFLFFFNFTGTTVKGLWTFKETLNL